MKREVININKLIPGVGRSEEWKAWKIFLQTYTGKLDDLQRDGTLWSLKLLHDDIKENGTLNPLIVEEMPNPNYYKVLIGNQRLLVQSVLNYHFVMCIVKEKNKSHSEVYEDLKKDYKDTHYDKTRRE